MAFGEAVRGRSALISPYMSSFDSPRKNHRLAAKGRHGNIPDSCRGQCTDPHHGSQGASAHRELCRWKDNKNNRTRHSSSSEHDTSRASAVRSPAAGNTPAHIARWGHYKRMRSYHRKVLSLKDSCKTKKTTHEAKLGKGWNLALGVKKLMSDSSQSMSHGQATLWVARRSLQCWSSPAGTSCCNASAGKGTFFSTS